MQVGSLVEWIGTDGTVEDGYGVVLDVNDKHVKVYWLELEGETHLSLSEGTVIYENDGLDIQKNRLREVVCE